MTDVTPPPRVAIVEDDADLRESIQAYLAAKGYPVWSAGSAEVFYKQLLIETADIALVDVGLPGESGFAVARHLKEMPGIAVIMLSGHDALEQRLHGLAEGADRYLVKPIDLRELAANIEACHAGRRNLPPPLAPAPVLPYENEWQLSSPDWELVSPCGARVKLTAREWSFMNGLVKTSGQIATRDDIARALQGGNLAGFDYHRIDMVVMRLRQKIARATGKDAPIRTYPSQGFGFSACCRVI